MNTAIVVPCHNALPHVQNLLAQIEAQLPKVPLVLVDDASGPETAQFLEQHALSAYERERDVILLRNERQQLFSRTANRGLRAAFSLWNSEAIAVVNTDCSLAPEWCYRMERALEKDPCLGIVGYRDGECQDDGSRKPFSYVDCPREYVTGHCMLIRTKMLLEVGVFSESDIDGREDPALRNVWGQAHIGSERILQSKAAMVGWRHAYMNFPGVKHGAGESWHRDLGWLSRVDLRPLWKANDTLTTTEEWLGN